MNRCPHRLPGIVLLGALALSSIARAQTLAPTTTAPPSTVPRSVAFTGQVTVPKADARTRSALLTFGLYTDQTGGTPIWTEQQLVALDVDGRYSVILGSTSADGLPADAFAAGTPRWLGVQVESDTEQPRFMLLSVPYALKAGDAETVGGKPVTEFVTSAHLTDSVKSAIEESKMDPSAPLVTTNALVKYATSGGALTESSTVDVGGKLGVQVAAPIGELDIAGFGSSTTLTLRNGGNAADVVKLVGADGSLRIGSATTANMINLIGPNVGLGTTAPHHRLRVSGGPPWSLNGWTGSVELDNASAIGWRSNGLGSRFGIGQSGGGLYFFRTASDPGTTGSPAIDDMVISDAGRVLVGPNGPTVTGQLNVISGNVDTPAIYGESANRGVWGKSTGSSRGVYGESATGEGVFGISPAGVGVSGTSTTSDGVLGMTAVPNASRAGVVGMSTGVGGVGVTGEATTGVYGHSTSTSGIGVTGQSDIGSGLGVYGTSASATGQGVHGDSTGANGYGVYAKNPSGMALGVEGNAAQSRDKGGMVKAMLYINADGTVRRCYNSQRLDGGAGLPPSGLTGCGFVVTHNLSGSYGIALGFQVNDRFCAITPETPTGVNIVAAFDFDAGHPNDLYVHTRITDVDWVDSWQDDSFMVIIY